MWKFTRALALILSLVFAGMITLAAAPELAVDTDIVAKCKADLAKRRNVAVKEITTVENKPTVWPDASLGMPEYDKAYAQMLTPGYKVILECKNSQYLYAASEKNIKYGGPVAIWSYSMLFLQPIENEPNLNGDLYQCSLMGTNSALIASGVSEYYPQYGGYILYTTRTSRSGFDLMQINAREPGKPSRLHSSFAYGAAALNKAQDSWAVFVKPKLGAGWNVTANYAGERKIFIPEWTQQLPDGVKLPGKIAWTDDKLLILVKKGGSMVCYEITPFNDSEWTEVPAYTFPQADYMLNKSETLKIDEVKKDGKPAVEVARVWFTGDRKVIAAIPGLTLRGYDQLTLMNFDFQPSRYLFIWGEQDGKPATYTVDIATGEVIPGLRGVGQNIKPFGWGPQNPPYRIVMAE